MLTPHGNIHCFVISRQRLQLPVGSKKQKNETKSNDQEIHQQQGSRPTAGTYPSFDRSRPHNPSNSALENIWEMRCLPYFHASRIVNFSASTNYRVLSSDIAGAPVKLTSSATYRSIVCLGRPLLHARQNLQSSIRCLELHETPAEYGEVGRHSKEQISRRNTVNQTTMPWNAGKLLVAVILR
jgi:hypothetical protein